MGHCIATGRKNYESIPEKFRPLPGRTNIVITRNKDYKAPGAVIVDSIEAAIDHARSKGETELFVIGGADVFRQLMPRLDKIYFTRVHTVLEGDVFFDDPDPGEWEKVWEEFHPADEKHAYSFTFMELVRRKKQR